MKKLAVAMVILYGVTYAMFPSNVEVEKEVKQKSKTNVNNVNVEIDKGQVVLDDMKNDGNGRFWGKIDGIDYMLHQGINDFLYVNGEFYKVNGSWNKDNYLLPEAEFKEVFKFEGERGSYKNLNTEHTICQNPTKETVLSYLTNPNLPIENAYVTKEPGQLPGANRDYRNGKHEGFDWYSGAIGTEISRQTKVYPIYNGRVVRVDHDYKELETPIRETMLDQAAHQKTTSQSTLDKLRGRQVWVQSQNGVLVRYAHLSSVVPTLKVGDIVNESTWIANVGNSGTSNGALGTDGDLHLHSDILVCGKNFWEYGEVEEMNGEMIKIFDATSETVNPGIIEKINKKI